MEKKGTAGTFCALLAVICTASLAENRTIDGSYNNKTNPYWGTAGSRLMRNDGYAYDDGVWTPAGQYRASPRVISNIVVAQDESMLNRFGRSDYLWAWGQILDHDIDLTEPAEPAEPFNIPVAPGDPQFDPEKAGGKILFLNRSECDRQRDGNAESAGADESPDRMDRRFDGVRIGCGKGGLAADGVQRTHEGYAASGVRRPAAL